MATAVNMSKLIAQVKKGATLPKAAEALGQPVSVVGPHYYKAEVEANPKLKFNATPASVVKAHDEEGLRWDRIAARTGKTVSQVKALYAEKRDLSDAYTGRGRKPGSNGKPAGRGASSRAAASGTRASGKRTGGRAASGRAASGRGRGRAASGNRASGRAASGGKGGRARTRAERAAKSGNPS